MKKIKIFFSFGAYNQKAMYLLNTLQGAISDILIGLSLLAILIFGLMRRSRKKQKS